MAEKKMTTVKCGNAKGVPGLPDGYAWANRKKDGNWCCTVCGLTHAPSGYKPNFNVEKKEEKSK